MNPIEAIIAMAKQIVAKVKAASKARQKASRSEYKVMHLHYALQDAVHKAYQKDAAAMKLALAIATVTPALKAALQMAEVVGEQAREHNLKTLQAQASTLTEAEQTASRAVPELEAGEGTWVEVKSAVSQVPELISQLKAIPGWSGQASSGYGSMTQVQTSAATKLSSGTESMPGSIRLVADLNEQIMEQLAEEILTTRLRIKGAPIGLPGSYACTFRAAHELAALTKVMNEHLNLQTSQAAIDSLEANVQAARNRVSESWPHS